MAGCGRVRTDASVAVCGQVIGLPAPCERWRCCLSSADPPTSGVVGAQILQDPPGGQATGLLAAGSLGFGLLTAITGTAQADTTCAGSVSVHGILSDGQLTYWAINPSDGDRLKTLIGPALGLSPKARPP